MFYYEPMNCERAIIVVGGVGSRNLPWSYANEKCQLPLPDVALGSDRRLTRVTRSVVDFVVEDCITAGIRDFTFIVGEGAINTRRAYAGNPPVEEYFKSRGKEHLLKPIKDVGSRATFEFIEQPYGHGAPYGTTYPLARARDVINQPGQTLVVMGDQLFYRADGSSEAKNLLDGVRKAGDHVKTGMLVMDVPANTINQYGITRLRPDGLLDEIVEKPPIGSIPDRKANASMYVIDKDFVPYIDKNMGQQLHKGNEHMITDALNDYAPSRPVAVVTAGGAYLDCGSPAAYEESFIFMRQRATEALTAER
jgi:UTP-glucose-1-phosphate uridylyltransferase